MSSYSRRSSARAKTASEMLASNTRFTAHQQFGRSRGREVVTTPDKPSLHLDASKIIAMSCAVGRSVVVVDGVQSGIAESSNGSRNRSPQD
jgi:hypothetical protein